MLWLTREDIDCWPNVREWLLSVNQYLLNDISKLTGIPEQDFV